MSARWVDHDTLEIPATALGDDGLIGDGMTEIHPDDSRWQAWADWLESHGDARPVVA